MAPIDYTQIPTPSYAYSQTLQIKKRADAASRNGNSDEGPTPLGWIAVAVVVPIMIMVLGLWACSRYQRGWKIGEISSVKRNTCLREWTSSNNNSSSTSGRLERNHRRAKRLVREQLSVDSKRITRWPGADYMKYLDYAGSQTLYGYEKDVTNLDGYERPYITTCRRGEEHRRQREIICPNCHSWTSWTDEYPVLNLGHGQDIRASMWAGCDVFQEDEDRRLERNRNAFIIEDRKAGTFHCSHIDDRSTVMKPRRIWEFGHGRAPSWEYEQDYEYEYEHEEYRSTTKRLSVVADVGGERRESRKEVRERNTITKMPRQIRPARLRYKRSDVSFTGCDTNSDSNHESPRRRNSSSSSSWTSRVSDSSSG